MKRKESLNKKKSILGGFLLLAIILSLIGGMKITRYEKNSSLSSENARAMEYKLVKSNDDQTNSDYVTFDAFFLRDLDGDGYAESLRGTCKKVGDEDLLYMELKVTTDGYLENAKITIDSGKNFYLNTVIPKDNYVKYDCISYDTQNIEFNTLYAGTQKILFGNVRAGNYKIASQKMNAIEGNINNYSRVNSITLTGTHVSDEGIRTEINKTIEFNVDWYGENKAEVTTDTSQVKDIAKVVYTKENEIQLDFCVCVYEVKRELNIKKIKFEAEIPKFNNYDPTTVTVSTPNTTYTYDPVTRILKGELECVCNEDGKITRKAYTEVSSGGCVAKFNVFLNYPVEAYTTSEKEEIYLEIPVKGQVISFNNPNSDFINPVESNIDTYKINLKYEKKVQGIQSPNVRIYVGTSASSPNSRWFVSKEKPLNFYDKVKDIALDDDFWVNWNLYTGNGQTKTSGIVLKEKINNQDNVFDTLIRIDGTRIDASSFITNKGIYFENAASILGNDGWIKVYDDETNHLIATFDKENWSEYTKSKPYIYELPVKHIRVETSETVNIGTFRVYNLKNIDNNILTQTFTKAEFESFIKIKSNVVGFLDGKAVESRNAEALYEAPMSNFNISVVPNSLGTQSKEEKFYITINTKSGKSTNEKNWKDAIFLVELPSEILEISIDDIVVTRGDIKISSYEIIEKNSCKYIKIITTSEDSEESFSIKLTTKVAANPKAGTATKQVKAYGYNQICENYYRATQDIYDINGNLNSSENVGLSTDVIDFMAPNTLLTSQTLKNFDDESTEVIAPEMGILNKERKNATIEFGFRNNYTNSISEIILLGKIPFVGNTFAINGIDMKSTYSVTMNSPGIMVPQAISEIVTVYYSENENPNIDLNDSTNGWTKTPSDFSRVKTFLVVFDKNYALPKDKEYYFSYDISIPTDLKYNQITYSHHGIYFCLDTEEGKYKTNVEPNKLGITQVRKFDLILNKFQEFTDKLIPGATYKVAEQDSDKSSSGTTDENGNIIIKDLLVEKTYIITEIISPQQYKLNPTEIIFRIDENKQGDLEATLISGDTRDAIKVELDEDLKGIITIDVEDEVRPNINLIVTEKETNNIIENAKYKMIGEGISKDGRLLITNENGTDSFVGLYFDEEYILSDLGVEGYYIEEPLKFKINKSGGAYNLETIEGIIKESTVIVENEIPTINIYLEKEKIPRYNLNIKALIRDKDTPLQGAEFRLIKDGKIVGNYKTDENGMISVPNLYAYEERKDVNQTYTLKQIIAPAGYSGIKDVKFKIKYDYTTDTYSSIIENGSVKENFVEGNTATFVVENSPTFKLVKRDSVTGGPAAGVKFEIYDEDTGEIAINGKGEPVGKLEEINGEMKRVITTDENGEVTLDLPQGFYKAIEVAAPDKYVLGNEESRTHYFGIGTSRTETGATIIENEEIGSIPNYDYVNGMDAISTGGYYVVGYQYSPMMILKNGQVLTKHPDADVDPNNMGGYMPWYPEDVPNVESWNGQFELYTDAYIIKYHEDGTIEWATNEGSGYYETFNDVAVTSDGGCISVGYFYGKETEFSNGQKILNPEEEHIGIIVKYAPNGTIEYVLNGKEYGITNFDRIITTTNNQYILTAKINEESHIVKMNKNGTFETIDKLNDTSSWYWNRYTDIEPTSDGGWVVSGIYKNEFSLNNGQVIPKSEENITNSFFAKYDSNGIAEFAETMTEMSINTVTELTNGDYIIAGEITNESLELKDGTLITGEESQYGSEIIIRYDKNRNIIYYKVYGIEEGTRNWDNYPSVYNVVTTENGEYLICGSIRKMKSCDGGYEAYPPTGNEDPDFGDEWWGEWFLAEYAFIEKYDSNNNLIWDEYITIRDTVINDAIQLKRSKDYIVNLTDWYNETLIRFKPEAIPERELLEVGNNVKTFKIRTNVKECETDFFGGHVSGFNNYISNIEAAIPYEVVSYGGSNAKPIEIIPDEGYIIKKITINGISQEFTPKEDGSYTLPTMNNITEDKIIEVEFVGKVNRFEINKIDSKTGEPLEGVEFRLNQIEEREEIDTEDVLGELTDNSNVFYEPKLEKEITGVLGELTGASQEYLNTAYSNVVGKMTNNNTYYFAKRDSYYMPTNCKQYREIYDLGDTGIQNSEAYSYIPIDLSQYSGEFCVTVNASVISEENADYGYAVITEDINPVSFENSDNAFMKISGNVSRTNYKSESITGGKIYYLHFGYRKNESVDFDKDEMVINSITVNKIGVTTFDLIEEDGKYKPTNSGFDGTTSMSYIPIDLTNYTGIYDLVINAEVSSEKYDYGFAMIRTSNEAPTTIYSRDCFLYISGNVSARDFYYPLEGGKKYYLYFGYNKGYSISDGDDTFIVNSINVYETNEFKYNFIENQDGSFVSTNEGKSNTVSNSYIPLDLRNYIGSYYLKINYDISSESSGDYGYVTIRTDTTAPKYSDDAGRIIYASGNGTNKEVTHTLYGGSLYYLHLGYYKNTLESVGNDKFTINDISLSMSSQYLKDVTVKTDNLGKAVANIQFGKFELTEINTPEGYVPNNTTQIIEFRSEEDGIITITNEKIKNAQVTVHYYIDGTTEKLYEDEILEGVAGEEYTTTIKEPPEKYEFKKDENGIYTLPENRTGIFTKEDQEVIYYYSKLKIPLTVNHFIMGTEDNVLLSDGTQKASEVYMGDEGESYTTMPLTPEELNAKYELVENAENAEGTYEYDEVIVNYFYKAKTYDVTTRVNGTGGTISGQDLESYENITYGENSEKEIVITPDYGYFVKEIKVNDQIIDFTANQDKSVILEKFEAVTENKDVVVTFDKDKGNVIVHHYRAIENEDGTITYTEEKLTEDEVKTGSIGNPFATKPSNLVPIYYGYFESRGITSGQYEEQVQEAIYYYKYIDFEYRIEYYYEGIKDESKTETAEALYESIINSYEDKVEIGYRFDKVEELPLTITENPENNVIRVYYVPDEAQTKDLRYTVEYYRDGIKVEEDVESTTVQLLVPNVLEVNKDKINIIDKYDGYKFVGTNPEVIPDTIENEGIIKVYYVKDEFEYRIEYYYEGIKDESKTETNTATFQEIIDTYTDKVIDGYVFERIEGKPIQIASDEESNVMKVFYVKRTDLSYTVKYLEQGTEKELAQSRTVNAQKFGDTVVENAIDIEGYNKVEPSEKTIEITTGTNEIIFYYTKRTDLNYRVEYYFENEIDNSLTDEFQATYLDVIFDYTDKVKPGYKYDSDTRPITIGVGENVIKVYYVIDEDQTKELSYKVEYYKDGEKFEEEVEKTRVQLLAPDTMPVVKEKINITNKYDGYKFVGTSPEVIPDTVTNGDIIKVNYEKDNFEYRVEYYFENEKDDSLTETNTAIFEEVINTYTDKVKAGYKLDKVEGTPLTITSNPANNVIKVYYVIDDAQTKELSYKVEYYKDGEKFEEEFEKTTVQLLAPDTMPVVKEKINVTDKYDGYKFVGTSPEAIPDTVTNGDIIKVNYEKDTFEYRVEYYFENEKDENLTETNTATFEEVINTYTDKVKAGYRLERVEGTPLTITSNSANNVIKVYYVIDDAQTKELSYKVEYYKDGEKFEEEVEKTTVQLLAPDTMPVVKEKINTTNKYDGYKFVGTSPEVIPDTVTNGDIIKVYYVRADFEYTVEYYFEGIKDESLTDKKAALFQEKIDTYTDKVKAGYKLDKVEGMPLTITSNSANNIIKVYYVIDEAQTKELSYKVEYYKDGEKFEEEVEKTTVQLLAPETMSVRKEKINITDKYDGYKFIETEPELIPETANNGDIIKVYYERADFEYRVEYYFEGIKDESLTDKKAALFQEKIDTYTDKVKVGYKLDKVEGMPLTVSENPANNVIRVYYVIDENQTKEISYKVEYYKDGIKAEEDIVTKEVQILADETLAVDKNEINTTDKYFGYKFANTDPTVIPDRVNSGEIIRVYYVIDETQTKELSYKVEYYKDNEKVEEETVRKTVQVLQPDTLDVEDINVTNKYDGYKCVRTEPEEIPETVTNGETIRVYYEKDTFEYSVEYYYEGVRKDINTEKNRALFQEVIETYTDKVEVGYKFERVEGIPLTISSDSTKNIIKVYYVADETQTKEISYTVEYYKDGNLAETEEFKEEVQVLEKPILTVNKEAINTINKYIGYELEQTEPLLIPDTIKDGDVIKVFYVRKAFEYRIEYYYDGVIDDSKTEIKNGLYHEIIDSYTDNEKYGYMLEKEENLPLMISENTEENVIRIYYIIDAENVKELEYTVEYYKDETLEETERFKEVVQVLEDDILNVDKTTINMTDKYVGYKFEKIDPEVIPDTIENGGIIKVFYTRKEYDYTVEYYYGGVKDESKTYTLKAKYGDIIENVEDKSSEGYALDRAENFPLEISENTENNVIRIYYIIDNHQTKEIKYTVEYYKDGILDEESTQVVSKTVQVLTPSVLDVDKTQINLVDKYDGYKLDTENTPEIPNIVNDGEVIKVYYVRKDAEVIVKYYEQNSENELAEEVKIQGKVFDEYKTEEKEIEGYTLVKVDGNEDGTMTEESIVVKYYYAKQSNVVIKHIDKNTGEVIIEEVILAKDGDILEPKAKDIPNYVVIEEPDERMIVVEKEDIEVIFVYVKVSAGVVEKHINIKSGEILKTITHQGNVGDPYETEALEFEGYDLVVEEYPENEDGAMTEELIEVKYYYIRKVTLKVEYIDIVMGEVLEENTIIIEGHEGDTYTTEEKELDGYVLIKKPESEDVILEVKTETDENGNVILDTETNVIYQYARKAAVIVEHIDINTGEKLQEDEYIEGYEGKEYTTKSKKIPRYEVIEESENKTGVMKVEEVVNEETGEVTLNRTTVVTYKYDKQPAKVIVKYVNKLTGEVLVEEEQDGRLDQQYKTEAKEIKDYRFVIEEYPENAEGVYTEETIVVTYYYIKLTKIIVYHVDNVSGEIVSEEIVLDGEQGEEYITKPIEIPGYVLVEDKYPENAEGEYDESDKEVYYYYVRETSVEVLYVDRETGEEIAEKIIIEGKEGDTYATTEKEIPYYELDKVENPEGKMEAIITKDEETGEVTVNTVTKVVYEYRKSIFDINVEKKVTEIIVNGESRRVKDGKLEKVEIHRKEITNSDVVVKYEIKVRNDGELEGTAIVSERIPENMHFYAKENPEWTEKGELFYVETEKLKPGESKTYEVILHWYGSDEIGTYTNNVEIVSTENDAKYDDLNKKDDKSESSVIIVTSTGIGEFVDNIDEKVIISMLIFVMTSFIVVKTLRKK